MIAHQRMSHRRAADPVALVVRLVVAAALSLTVLACSEAPESGEQAEPGAATDAGGAGDATGAGDTTGAGAAGAVATQPKVLIPAPQLADIELRNQNDEPVAFEQLRGKPTLLTFIYTRCPMPEMCPATTLRFQEVQKALSAEQRAQVQLIAVSFDPTYDTPEVLAEYADLWNVDDSFWALLTGTEEDIHRVASSYGVWYEQSEDGNFNHSMYSMILFPDGALHQILQGSAWDSKEVAGKLVEMAAASVPAPH